MKTVIMAGGKGTRISSIYSSIPKPMIPIDGVPVLEREINCLRSQGFDDIIITVSHMSEVIMNYFGDGNKISPVTGKPFGVKIKYFVEDIPLGNAGALFKMKDELTEDFLLLNADAVFDIDFNRFVAFHKQHGKLVTLFTHPNNHPYDSGLIITGANNEVDRWLTKEDERPKYYKNRVNAGLHVISPKVLEHEINTPKIDLDRQVIKPLCGTGNVIAYDSPEYVRDMGTPDRYFRIQEDFKTGIIEGKNLAKKQKAIFLDRDGTINVYKGFIRDPKEIELLPGVAKAIKKINEMGYLAIIVTNQPVIARGESTVENLNEMHNKIETLLGNEGAYVDGIYYCPHHPDKGFEGEIPELKIDCDCRKPKPGLLIRAAKDFNIDLEKSWMIGDELRDVQAGLNAGCSTILISSKDEQYGANERVDNLLEGVELIENSVIKKMSLKKD